MQLYFRHFYWRWLKNQAFLFLVFLILMTIGRIGFAFFFGDSSALIGNPKELYPVFWLGMRFDLMPLAYINILPFILMNIGFFLPGKRVIRIIRRFNILFLTFGYLLLMWIYIFDYGFYSYFQDHLNVLVFGFFEDDTQALLITLYKNYNLILWLSVVAVVHYVIYRLVRLMFSLYDFDLTAKKFNYKMPLAFSLGIIFLAFTARGNFSRLPLSLEDAHVSDNEFLNEVSLNGVLTLNRAIKIRKTHGNDKFDYLRLGSFENWQDAYFAYKGKKPSEKSVKAALTQKTKENNFLKQRPPHVVMVVMESFGSYWNEEDSESFQILGELKPHLSKGILFKNFLSAENGTIGSIVSVATSEVIRPGARFLSESEFMRTKISSSGNQVYKDQGYDTHFVYGGKLGWRDLGKFLMHQKFDHLWGADEVKEAMPELNNVARRDLGNEWGIFDEYLYSFIDEQLRTATRPQFFLVLTTSNHPPFEYPSTYKPLPLDLGQERLDRITVDRDMAQKRFTGLQYANQKVGEFLTKINQSILSDNTIVALTGDHSFWIARSVGATQEFKRYAVPFFISLPDAYRPEKIDKSAFGSHEDIYPTLFNLSLSNTSYVSTGESLFSGDSFAMNSSGLVANKQGAFHSGKFWKWKDLENLILEPSEETPELVELRIRSLGQIGVTDAFLKEEKTSKQTVSDSDRP